jgi:CheY-like chemotaxis protein
MRDDEVEIVIVEDNPNDAELLVRAFKRHGVANQIVLLKDGVEAMDFLFSEGAYADRPHNNPKVMILDLKLPKVNGIEVLRRIKADERTKTVPVVVLTSSREDRDLKDAYESGVNSYVTKPIKFDEFSKVVSDLKMYWLLVNKAPVG